jgi:PadR family transcriptional regulator, regulatory protein AphA
MRGDVGHVLLGLLQWRPRSGYEIKQLVDRSTRFFWAVSYGQIYPELRRLEEEGLVEAESDPVGARRRTRYRLTEAGRAELRAWLLEPRAGYELRDEGLLKLFFSQGRDADSVRELARSARRRSEEVAARLRELDPDVDDPEPGPLMVLRFGIALNEWMADWWAQAERRAGRTPTAKER